MNLLSILFLIFAPAITGLFILSPVFPNNEIKIRRFAKGFAIFHFIYSLLFLLFFNPTNFGWSYQKELTFFNTSWLKTLGITATFGVDGISLSFVILTSFLIMLAIIISKSMIRTKHRIYYPLLLMLETAIIGVFCAKDIFLFLLFWQLELIPMYFLISQWGDKGSNATSIKYTVYTFLGSAVMCLGLLVLYFYSFSINGILTGDIESLSISENVFAQWFQAFIFFCLFFGFAIKLPIIPFHTWLPKAQVEAASPISMVMSGALTCMGCYGIIRFNIELFPEIFSSFAHLFITLGLINLLYGAILATTQNDIKKIIAYTSISQIGFVLIGLGSLNDTAFNGSIFHIISNALVISGLYIITGIISLRTKTREITALGGLSQIMPICMYLGLIIYLSAINMPFSSNFIAKFLIINGLSISEIEPQSFIIGTIILIILSLIISTYCIIQMFHKIFYGPILSQFKTNSIQYDEDGNEINIIYPKRGITKSEIIVLTLLIFAIILFGVFPNSLLDIFQTTSEIILDFIKV